MDPSMILQIIAIIILLMLSAYFSSAETALTTVNPHSMRAMAEDGNKKSCYCFKIDRESKPDAFQRLSRK